MFNTKTLYANKEVSYPTLWNQGAVIFLLTLGIISRLPFQSNILHHWDSVNFALALDHFDLYTHRPHPPGMFVFYILLGRLINWALQDPNASLVWISIITSGLGAAAIFSLSKSWFGWQEAVTIALVMLTSPLVWFHGEVALSYMPEFFWVLLIVYACFRTGLGDKKALFLATLFMGLAGGIRPNTSFFMFPLWAVSVIVGLRTRNYHLKHVFMAILLGVVGVLLWLIPLIVMAGGPLSFWETILWWQAQHTEASGQLTDLFVNSSRLIMFTFYALGIGLIPLIWVLFNDWRQVKDYLLHDWRAQTLALWIIPGLTYFIVIHLRQPGHTFTIIPGFIMLSGLAIISFSQYLKRFNKNAWVIVTTLVVAFNLGFFLFGPANLFGDSRLIFSTPTWTTIREYDAMVTHRLQAIRQNFPPEQTFVIASSRNFRLPDFYLSDYQLTTLAYNLTEKAVVLPDQVNTVVLFDDEIAASFSINSDFQQLPVSPNEYLKYITWDSSQQAKLTNTVIEIQPR
jgi:hypothetical protein